MFLDILNASQIIPSPPPSYCLSSFFITNAKFPIHIQNFIYPRFGYDDEIRSTPQLQREWVFFSCGDFWTKIKKVGREGNEKRRPLFAVSTANLFQVLPFFSYSHTFAGSEHSVSLLHPHSHTPPNCPFHSLRRLLACRCRIYGWRNYSFSLRKILIWFRL